MRVGVHGAPASECVTPACVVSAARRKRTVPKSASGRIVQLAPTQSEGASAIHSAEVTSSVRSGTRREKRVPRVRSDSVIATCARRTATRAVIRSPGTTLSGIACAAAGTSSYQALDVSLPSRRQSSSVPICSRARAPQR